MMKKLILSCLTVAAIGVGMASAVTTADAHYLYGNPGIGFGLFGSPGYYDDGYYGDGYYGNYYDDGYYGDGYYGGYHHMRRHASHRCHIGNIRYHHRLHHARICNGHVTKVY